MYANYTGLVTLENGRQASLREGDIYDANDPVVKEKPELFTDTEPNSQVAGAFPMEGTLRNSELTKGDVVEEKRWEGNRPPGYEKSDEDRSPTASDELRQEGEPERKKDSDSSQRSGAGRVERATAAPGEKRNVTRAPSKTTDK